MSKKHAKSARFESCAPIMPQNAPKKNPNKIPEKKIGNVHGFHLYTSVLIILIIYC